MNRRVFLAAVAASANGLAGCTSDPTDRTTMEHSPTPQTATESDRTERPIASRTRTATVDPNAALAQRGRPTDICTLDRKQLGIEAIVTPTFDADWTGYDTANYGGELDATEMVVGLEHDGQARAYPVRVLWEHEVVNDTFGDPIVVTFCSLCSSGMVAERTVDDRTVVFGVSGQLWTPPGAETAASREDGRIFGAGLNDRKSTPVPDRDRNLVMYDSPTGSYWSQLLATAICGPHRGARLPIVPSTVAS